MEEPTHVSIRLPKEIYDAVGEKARTEERSVTAEVRRILKSYLADQGRPLTTT